MKSKDIKNIIVVSLFCGMFVALFAFLVLKYLRFSDVLELSVLGSVLFAVILFCFLFVHTYIINKKYSLLEKGVVSHVFFKTNGNFNLGKKVINGNIYFCDDGITMISVDVKPYCVDEILLKDMDTFQFDNIHLNITTKDNRLYSITLPDAKHIIEILKNRGWF